MATAHPVCCRMLPQEQRVYHRCDRNALSVSSDAMKSDLIEPVTHQEWILGALVVTRFG
jgi:hypothetical protein